jgi:gas vesicle protein
MPQLTQGLIVAGLIGLLLAVIVGYYLRQGQINELTETLQRSQKRQEDLAVEHEQRLRDATQQLQKDYEAQLAEKMEQYQIQLEEQRSRLESEYRARQSLEGDALAEVDSLTEQRIRKQYETRLKEAAAKIQQAYEQHLQEKLAEARSYPQPEDNPQRLASLTSGGVEATNLTALEQRLQAEYDQRLAERIAEYQDDMTQRMAQLEQEYEARLQMAQPTASPELVPSANELELNLRRELEASLREEYDQRLAAEIEHYQNQLTQRTQELEQSYEALQTAPIDSSATQGESASDDIFGLSEGDTGGADDLNFDALLDENQTPGEQDATLAFDADFGTEELDLEALLNTSDPDNVPDEQIEGLDDISDLS